MLSVDTNISQQPSCYFSIVPASPNSHFSAETPCCSPVFSPGETPSDPSNPFLAYRQQHTPSVCSSPTMAASSLLQLQTAAAYGHTSTRPQPRPVQNVLEVTSDDSTTSTSSSSSSSSHTSSLELARCSRCQRTPSTDFRTGKSNMVEYGLNLWYCTRCAAMVGLVNR